MTAKLITKAHFDALIENGRLSKTAQQRGYLFDPVPVVKLFTPDANCTWLLSEIDPDAQDLAFGLCDLGMGFPELGSVLISEIKSVRGKLGLPVERDLHFNPDKPISEYAMYARNAGHIVV